MGCRQCAAVSVYNLHFQGERLFTVVTTPYTIRSPGLEIHYRLDGGDPAAGGEIYTAPLHIRQSARLRACAVDPATGTRYGDERQYLLCHAASRCSVYRCREDALIEAPELSALVDGRLGDERIFHAHEWTELDADLSDLAIALPQSQPLRALRLNFEAGRHRQLYFPSALEVWLADDPAHWRSLAHLDTAAIAAAGGRLDILLGSATARYLRLRVHNLERHYSPERRRPIRRPLYLDEIALIAG